MRGRWWHSRCCSELRMAQMDHDAGRAVRVGAAPPRPVLVYDGKCSFCRRWVERWREATGDRLEYAPSQEAGARFPEIAPEAFGRSVWLVETDGSATPAAGAVFRALALAGRRRWLLWLYESLPAFRDATEVGY